MATMRSTPIESGSPDRFGYEWKTYSEMRPEYEEQFRRWTVHLSRQDWSGKAFLDVGCGMGRNSYWPLSYGATSGVAIDVDRNSLASARQTLARFPNGTVREMSAYEIEYTDFFDIVFSIGVIHHLEFPELALGQMVKAANPGGRVLIWVYGSENNEWLVNVLDPVRKALFSRMPMRFLHHLALYPAALLWIALRLGVGRIAYFEFLREIKFRHLRSIVLDQMLPKIAHYWPRQTVERLMRNAGLEDVRLAWVNEMSWSAIGTKRPVMIERAAE
jgi:SAM-dependent methyltransferase